jgi:sugar lactone lactonase YvrE
VAGGEAPGFSGDGGSALEAKLSFPLGVSVDATGRLYVADTGNSRVRRIDRVGNIATVAGNGGFRGAPDGTQASSAFFSDPEGLAFDSAGNLLVSDAGNVRLRLIDRARQFHTIAGSGLTGCCIAGPALNDLIGYPTGIVADPSGNIYFSDTLSYRVRRLSAEGTIATYAGTGVQGYGGDGGPATEAQLAGPYGLALDRLGNLYIADTPNQRIRRVSPDGVIGTFAGSGARGFAGDNGPATAASLRDPNAIAMDSQGNVLIADLDNNRIRSVSPGGIITTLAGSGIGASTGDDGPAVEAALNGPAALAIDPEGNISSKPSCSALWCAGFRRTGPSPR